MQLFWRRGYETTSMSDLIAEMGVTAPSIYSVFGDKEQLFLEAVERYWNGPARYAADIFAEEPTAERAVKRTLEKAAISMIDPAHPPGCMVALSAINCSASSANVQSALARYRGRSEKAIRARIERGIAEGDVPKGTDAVMLANFFSTVLYGMSIRARDGASRKEMLVTVEAAMKVWPKPARR